MIMCCLLRSSMKQRTWMDSFRYKYIYIYIVEKFGDMTSVNIQSRNGNVVEGNGLGCHANAI